MRRVSGSLFAEFAARAGLPGDASLGEVVAAIQAIPYGRPTSRTPEGVLGEWKGTCSTKHALLARIVAERWPQLRPRLVHRVYRADRAFALSRYGALAAGAVPDGGLTDVHRYLLLACGDQDVGHRCHLPRRPTVGWAQLDAAGLRRGSGLPGRR
jgi:hypothetical protein